MKPQSRVRFHSALLGLWVTLICNACGAAVVEGWVQRYGSPAGGYAIAVGPDGNIYATGGASAHYATVAFAGAGAPLWTNLYKGPGNGSDVAYAIAVDQSTTNVYVTGRSYRDSVFTDLATVAYTGGGVPLWTNRYPGSAVGRAIAVGPGGSVHVAGTVGGMQAHYVVLAYSAAGTALWTNTYSRRPDGTDVVEAMGLDTNGNVFVTGWSSDTAGRLDYATLAYSSSGTPLWTNRYTGPGVHDDAAYSLAVDPASGDVYVTGDSYNQDSGHADYATVAYSGAGVPLWTNRLGTTNSGSYPNAVAVGPEGNVYVTGLTAVGGTTVAYSRGGVPLWTNECEVGGWAVAVSERGEVVITGNALNADGTAPDYATVSYSAQGERLWSAMYDGPAFGYDYATALALAPDGSVYVTGNSEAMNEDGVIKAEMATVKYLKVPDIWFTGIHRPPNLPAVLSISAPANTPYGIEASSDFTDWVTLTNFPPLPVTSMDYTDTDAPLFPRRFYRAVWSP